MYAFPIDRNLIQYINKWVIVGGFTREQMRWTEMPLSKVKIWPIIRDISENGGRQGIKQILFSNRKLHTGLVTLNDLERCNDRFVVFSPKAV